MPSLAHWDPFRALRRRDETLEDFVRDFFGRTEGDALEPPVELGETEAEVTVKMVVPGVEKDQLDISVDDHVLRVKGETKKESEEKKKNYYRQEIRYGAFERAVRLPSEVDHEHAKADLKNGMLTVTLPKSKASKSKQIKVAS
jgi:HSP20 family protein